MASSNSVKTSCCNSKMRVLGAKYVWLSNYFNFQNNSDVLKSNSPCFLSNKKLNINKTKNQKWNFQHTFRDPKLVPLTI